MLVLERIISVSSEDPAWPAENLLKTQGKSYKWKCKEGERNASVVIQLAKASRITSVDVGNENSAFIEILVGKSCFPDDQYKVLLVASSLMSLKEAKDLSNSNSVRFFKVDNFCKPESEDKWDRVKIVCSQPYNRHVQFGLAFITFHGEEQLFASTTASEHGKTTALGKFTFKQDEGDGIAVGSIFARRKELQSQDQENSSATAIRLATAQLQTPSSSSVSENQPKTPKPAAKAKVAAVRVGKKKQDPTDNVPVQSPDSKADWKRVKPKIDPSDVPDRKRMKKDDRWNDSEAAEEKSVRRASAATTSSQVDRKQYRPFAQLLSGVVFTISGIQNPTRADLRNKALAMGAKYRPDWDNTCTHLVCAFANTPKFNQVRGHGRIVKRDWVEQCHCKRTRLPWRRFALDPKDGKKPESEDEIYEEDESVVSSSVGSDAGPSRAAPPSLFADLPKRTPNKNQNGNDKKSPRARKTPVKKAAVSEGRQSEDSNAAEESRNHTSSTSCSSPRTNGTDEEPPDTPVNLDLNLNRVDDGDGCDDTESDADWPDRALCDDGDDGDSYPLPYLPEQFSDLSFYVAPDIATDTKSRVKRYITAHSGSVDDTCCQDTEYVIAASSQTVDQLKERCPNIVGVQVEWIWRCHDQNILLPTSKFEL